MFSNTQINPLQPAQLSQTAIRALNLIFPDLNLDNKTSMCRETDYKIEDQPRKSDNNPKIKKISLGNIDTHTHRLGDEALISTLGVSTCSSALIISIDDQAQVKTSLSHFTTFADEDQHISQILSEIDKEHLQTGRTLVKAKLFLIHLNQEDLPFSKPTTMANKVETLFSQRFSHLPNDALQFESLNYRTDEMNDKTQSIAIYSIWTGNGGSSCELYALGQIAKQIN